MQSCSYIIWEEGQEDCFLIDCGDAKGIIDYFESHSIQPKGIFITHCHYDHIYGINDVVSKYPECRVYGSEDTLEGLYDAKVNISFYFGHPLVISSFVQCVQISAETRMDVLGCKLHILETPGHDSGCLCYQYQNFLFTGDSYIPFSPVFSKWKRSNKDIAIQQEQKIKEYVATYHLDVLCGHYQTT